MNNPYVSYYLEQQQGRGMPVFRGSPWQMGYGQMGYGLGGLFRNVARAMMPMVKSGAKTLGKLALNAGANVLGDIASGRNLKESVKSRGKEAANVAKNKAVNRLQTYAQTGSGKRKRQKASTVRGRQTKKRKTVKKRKASTSTTRRDQTKKRRTALDIFG